jgi:hypothetical protein
MQASAEESPVGGVGGSYQERVRLTCISENQDKLVDSKWVFKLKRDANG